MCALKKPNVLEAHPQNPSLLTFNLVRDYYILNIFCIYVHPVGTQNLCSLALIGWLVCLSARGGFHVFNCILVLLRARPGRDLLQSTPVGGGAEGGSVCLCVEGW